jgi:hypothetical protein
MDNIANALGILGAYFAVLMVLAVGVEVVLEPFTLFKGLRKKVSPEEFAADVKEWIAAGSDKAQKAEAITKLAERINIGVKDIQAFAAEMAAAAETVGIPGGADIPKELMNIIYKYQYSLDEKKRIAILRLLSAAIGVVIAVILQLDSFVMLSGLIPKGAVAMFSTPMAHWGGIILTGLSASAGSSFWHDQLAKVRAVKEVAGKSK